MTDPVLYYVCAIIAVILSGLAKGGFAGIGALAMPIMAMGIDPLRGGDPAADPDRAGRGERLVLSP